MKKSEIVVGGLYRAKVSGKLTTVRVDAIRQVETMRYGHTSYSDGSQRATVNVYDVTNLTTGRQTTFRSAAKFRGTADHAIFRNDDNRHGGPRETLPPLDEATIV